MRKWNKLLAMLLAMVMVLGLTATALAEEDDPEGEPVPISVNEDETPEAAEAPAVEPDLSNVEGWAQKDVTAIVKQGLMDLTGTDFRPEDKMTRVELVVALYRMEKSPSVEGKENKFEDIADLTEEQQAAIVWAASEEIVNGEEENLFNPNGNVERQQIAKILFVYAKAEEVEEDKLAGFPDAADVQDYAVKCINWLVAKGIMNGDDGLLNPAGNATRVQVAAMLNRYITEVLSAAEPTAPEGETDAEPAEGETDATEPAEGETEGDDAAEPTEGEEDKAEGADDGETEPAEGDENAPAEGDTEPAEGEDASTPDSENTDSAAE